MAAETLTTTEKLEAYRHTMRDLMRRATGWEERYPSPRAGHKRMQHRNELRRTLALMRDMPTVWRLKCARRMFDWGRMPPADAYPGVVEHTQIKVAALVALETFLGVPHQSAPEA